MKEKSRQTIFMLISGFSLLLLVGAGFLLLKPKLHDESKWTVYTSDAGKFKAFFCGEIQTSDTATSRDAGAVINHSVMSARPDGVGMGVTWADFPETAFATSKPEEMVNAICVAAADGGIPTGITQGIQAGLYRSSIEFHSKVDGSYNRNIVTIKGRRIYTVFGHGPQGAEIRRDLNQFFDSFVVIE